MSLNVQRPTCRSGWMLTETITATAILMILVLTLNYTLNGLRKFNDYQQVRRRCVAAAQAQLDSIVATDRQLTDEEIERLWPGLTVEVAREAGDGGWQRLQRIQVIARGQSIRRNVSVELSRYATHRGK